MLDGLCSPENKQKEDPMRWQLHFHFILIYFHRVYSHSVYIDFIDK